MKKIIFLIISIILFFYLNACAGYKPIYSSSNFNFISSIKYFIFLQYMIGEYQVTPAFNTSIFFYPKSESILPTKVSV